jgi:hypothetical protein
MHGEPKFNTVSNDVGDLDADDLEEAVWFEQVIYEIYKETKPIDGWRTVFPGRIVSLFGKTIWPARYPELRAHCCSLRGHLKSNV